ncbi:saccharopine dehydrogenase family protein [Aestuariivivens sediminis]|uniref:saccharopine dehydrogenase family protein n=1 Tax=Aestuariivivens sediminis TaxID=2913557 RepID=UPI001F5812E6|nr:saccharopine dehydrogenase C-terminal domain-containing protein [Aestuariivivens sediminis]
MIKSYNIIIAGAGGIASAVALMLAEWSDTKQNIFIGNRTLKKAQKIVKWVKNGTTKSCSIIAFHLPEEGVPNRMKNILIKGDILLDCLPGSMAPKLAKLAKDFHLHYANLTEYVAETNKIMELAKNADTGFILQTGLAPGYINVLGHYLFQNFCKDFKVKKVDKLELKVGALTDYAVEPYYYTFTWNPAGVATEYLKDTIVIRDFKKTVLPALSEKTTVIIDGVTYEDDLTSGGAADLPDLLEGKVRSLNYKTLRYPGHYSWVGQQIKSLKDSANLIKDLQKRMEESIPHVENDLVVLYAAVEGKDVNGVLRRRETVKKIKPKSVGKQKLRAIQLTTAAPLLQSAQQLLEIPKKGVVLQGQLETEQFLNGHFVKTVYGETLV